MASATLSKSLTFNFCTTDVNVDSAKKLQKNVKLYDSSIRGVRIFSNSISPFSISTNLQSQNSSRFKIICSNSSSNENSTKSGNEAPSPFAPGKFSKNSNNDSNSNQSSTNSPFASGKFASLPKVEKTEKLSDANYNVDKSPSKTQFTPQKISSDSPALGNPTSKSSNSPPFSPTPSPTPIPNNSSPFQPKITSSPFDKPSALKSSSSIASSATGTATVKQASSFSASNKRLIQSLKQVESKGGKNSNQSFAPSNIFDDPRRTPEEIEAEKWRFSINFDQFLLILSFFASSLLMLGTAYLVWKVGAIHFNDDY